MLACVNGSDLGCDQMTGPYQTILQTILQTKASQPCTSLKSVMRSLHRFDFYSKLVKPAFKPLSFSALLAKSALVWLLKTLVNGFQVQPEPVLGLHTTESCNACPPAAYKSPPKN